MKYRLDHVALATLGLEGSRQVYTRMGFKLSPLSMHSGSTGAADAVIQWGSGNHLAMLHGGYFELLGLVDQTLPSNVKSMVAKYEGMHVLALRCESAERTYKEITAAGMKAREPMSLERDASFGPEGTETRRARFRNVYLDGATYPEACYILIEHCTPEVMWQPHLMTHPNGARALAGAYLVSEDIEGAARRLQPLLGEPAPCAVGLQFDLTGGKLWMCTQSQLRAVSPVLAQGPVHSFAAVAIRVQSLDALKSLLKREGIAFVAGRTMDERYDCVWIGAEQGNHGVIQFVQ